MDFTLRFMLGFALVLATCSLFECATSWRHIRQAPPIEAAPDAPISHDDISTVYTSVKEENINNASRKIENGGQLQPSDGDNRKAEKNDVNAEKKPKTENSTEKQISYNKINVNITSIDHNTKVDKKNETSLEKPLLKDLDSIAADSKQNYLKQESQKTANAQQRQTTPSVPEIKPEAPTLRAENARSLDIDIGKYVSSEFHNKNNVYSLSVSPDTEKYTNLHNELPKSTTSKMPTQAPSGTIFGAKLTTPLYDDFDKKYQTIEDGVKQKLEYIDHQFAEADYDFKKSQDAETVNISKILDEIKNDTAAGNLNYSKFKNITDSNSGDKNSIHKEIDVETGHNVDYTASYNKTHVFVEPPKDYRNKIPTQDDDFKSEILSEILPEHSDVKPVYRPAAKPIDIKRLEGEVSNEKIPEINFKESTSLTKPPSLNQTENHKSLISNKIETEVVNPVENNMKMKWDFPFVSTETATGRTTKLSATSSATPPASTTTKLGQQEEAVYVPYGKGNLVNVSKRGSTKFVDTLKLAITTESSIISNNPTLINSTSTNKSGLISKQPLTNTKNKTMEQSVLENQVYPVQIPAPSKEPKDEKAINDTTEKPVMTEDTSLSLKLYTYAPTQFTVTTLSTTSSYNETAATTSLENVTTTQTPEWTTSLLNNTVESTTSLDVNLNEKTTTEQVYFSTSTIKEELETTTTFDNLTTIANTETIVSSTTLYPTTLEVETTATNYVIKNDEFTTKTYRIDFTTDLSEDNSSSSQESLASEATTSEEVDSGIAYTTNSKYLDDTYSTVTTSDYEDSGSSSNNSTDYSEYDERSSSGRDLKGNSNEASFSSIDESLNNLDLNVPSTTTDKNLNHVTTEEPIWPLNKTDSGTKNRTSEIRLGTTSDYRENIIIKQNESTTTTKRPEETSDELDSKTNFTDTNGDDNGEFETEDEGDLQGHYSTLSPRNVLPNIDDTTPFIIPLNTSTETDSTDSTTIADNLGLEDNGDGNGGPIAAIIISCIGAACLVLLAGLLFIMRKRHKRFNYGQRCTPVSLDAYSVDNVSVYNSMRRKGAMRASKRSYGNPAFEDPSSVSRSLNFPALAKFSSNTEAIGKEFEEIPQVTAQTNELPEGCEMKNRYANVIPLPETRVFLGAIDGYPNSDYINANYVTGPKSARGYYIACQAPMQSTVDDFWRMVWEQQTKVILMLTHLFENGTEKCVDYLPPSEVLDCHRLFGDFQVTLKNREVKEKYVISSLQLKNMVSNSWREVTHLWYLGWPEKGVPSEANSLIAFLIEARSYFKTTPLAENGKPKETTTDTSGSGAANSEQSPVIVHCSPGTGRTGTVIACDIAIREFELTRQVDIPKTVYRIRRDRASSVQTKEQYGFIYKVICLYATKLTGGVLDSL